MAQARTRHPSPRDGRQRLRRESEALRAAAAITELSRRGRETHPSPPRRRPRLPLLTFVCGIGLGYGLAGPLPGVLAPLLAGLTQARPAVASLIAPLRQGRILVMGTDHVGANTDVMLTVEVRDGRTVLTQVPRDTYVESQEHGVLKANALYATGGADLAKQELSSLLSAPVDRYVVVNLDAVRHLADAIGGVEIDVPKRMAYVDNSQGLYIDLYPGPQLLKGEELEGYLRFRHDELGDIGRMERQKLVFQQVFRKLAQPAMITRLPELLAVAGRDVRTDLSPVELGRLLTAMATTRLSTERLPGRPYWQDDLSYWMPSGNRDHPPPEGESPDPPL